MKSYDISIYNGTMEKIKNAKYKNDGVYEEEMNTRLERVKASIICKPLLEDNNIRDILDYLDVLTATKADQLELLNSGEVDRLNNELMRVWKRYSFLEEEEKKLNEGG
ncbi:hypothetical protein ACH3O9_11400 [Leeuwenhoekiella sp. A16]|uniref:hypothetical protein n=1 Tax=Leeuwenhoekiella sp. A16 TaxID=3141462 RepID=UPI003A808D2E